MGTERTESPGVSAARFRAAAVFSAIVMVVQVAWLQFEIGGEWATLVFSDVILVPVPLAAAAACWLTARRESGRTRRGWVLIGAGVASWGVGEAIWSWYEVFLGREVPYPSLADVGYLGLIPLTVAGLLCFRTAPSALIARSRILLDGLIITTSLFALAWALVLGPIFRAGGESILEQTLGLAYPFGDLILIGLVLFMAARASRVERLNLGLIGAGIVALSISDTAFTYFTFNETYASGNVIDNGWTLGFLLIGLGALRGSPPEQLEDRPTSKIGAMMPYAAIFFGVPVAVYKFLTEGTLDPVVFLAGIALFVAVQSRQLIAVLENRALASRFEQKVVERTADLQKAIDELREASRRQDEFVSRASHELFTPLTTIVGAVDLLSDPAVTPWEEASELLKMVASGARRMTQLVDDLLLASGLTGFIACERALFDVAAVVRDSLEAFRPVGRTIESRLTTPLMAVGDPARLKTAINHLLSNAEKFGPPGSTIYVTTRLEDGEISIAIGDEGPGISNDIREYVFERFYQADATDTRRYGGLGLGLYLTRQVVMAMGGDVSIDDAEKGCTIRVTLPAPGTDNDAQLPVRIRVATSGVRRGLGSVDRDP